jgi:hypothetical protein
MFTVRSSGYSTVCKCLKLQVFKQELLPHLEAKTMKKESKNCSESSEIPFSSSSTPRILYIDVELSVSSSGRPHL